MRWWTGQKHDPITTWLLVDCSIGQVCGFGLLIFDPFNEFKRV
jgi:hypothetical protein